MIQKCMTTKYYQNIRGAFVLNRHYSYDCTVGDINNHRYSRAFIAYKRIIIIHFCRNVACNGVIPQNDGHRMKNLSLEDHFFYWHHSFLSMFIGTLKTC